MVLRALSRWGGRGRALGFAPKNDGFQCLERGHCAAQPCLTGLRLCRRRDGRAAALSVVPLLGSSLVSSKQQPLLQAVACASPWAFWTGGDMF